MRAYIHAGCPGELPMLASFGDWSRLVRSALVWLGKADPVETMETARSDDPEANQFAHIIVGWKNVFGMNNPRTAGEIIKALLPETLDEDDGGERESLTMALREVAQERNGKFLDATRLGKWLSKHDGKVVLGMKLVGQLDRHTQTKRWSLHVCPR